MKGTSFIIAFMVAAPLRAAGATPRDQPMLVSQAPGGLRWLFAAGDASGHSYAFEIDGSDFDRLVWMTDTQSFSLGGYQELADVRLFGGPHAQSLTLGPRHSTAEPSCLYVTLDSSRAEREPTPTAPRWSSPGPLNLCPRGFWTWDEHADDERLRTCARIRPDQSEHVLDMLTVVEREGVIDAFVLDMLDPPNPPMVYHRPGCWPWIRDPNAHSPPRHHRGYEVEWDDEGRLATLVGIIDGLRSGVYLVMRGDGTPAVLGSYQDDLPHGVWAWVGTNGALLAAKLFVYGVDAGELPVETRWTD